MAVGIGRASMKVVLLDKSPWGAQPKQEFSTFFTNDVVKSLTQQNLAHNVDYMPEPINGFRAGIWSINEWHNRLDGLASPTTKTDITIYPNVNASNAATLNQDIAASADPSKDDFFTWKIINDLTYTAGDVSRWTYALNPVGDQDYLMPFYNNAGAAYDANNATQSASSSPSSPQPATQKGISDFAIQTKYSIGTNQAFQISIDTISRQPFDQRSKATFSYYPQGKTSSQVETIKLNQPYVLITIGNSGATAIGKNKIPAPKIYLLLMRETKPMLFVDTGLSPGTVGPQTVPELIAVWQEAGTGNLFAPNDRRITIQIESAVGFLMITIPEISNVPWVVGYVSDTSTNNNTTPSSSGTGANSGTNTSAAPNGANTPNSTNSAQQAQLILQGPIAVYGGNTQMGISLGLFKFHRDVDLKTVPSDFVVNDASATPNVSMDLKGGSDIQQFQQQPNTTQVVNVDYSTIAAQNEAIINGTNNTVLMVDTETLNEQAISNPNSAEDKNTSRDVSWTLIKGKTATDGKGNTSSTIPYSVNIDLTASDVTQGNGYVNPLGRSPYVFLVRMELPTEVGATQSETTDLSCDVMSVDLSWNATSYYEMEHCGSIKLLNNNPNGRKTDYTADDFLSRTHYVRVFAWWEDGAGQNDPGTPIFEGMTVGATIDTQAGLETVTFKVEDYMNAYAEACFDLCPYYDAMWASLAVRDIVMTLGFDPSRILADDATIPYPQGLGPGQDMSLPFSSPLDQPQFFFKAGTPLKEGIVKIATMAGRTIFFDVNGNFHYELMPGGIYTDSAYTVSNEFYTKPNGTDMDFSRLAWNSYSRSYMMNNVYNGIRMRTSSKALGGGGILAAASTYLDGITDPSAPGYLGFAKTYYKDDAYIGTVQGLFNQMTTLRDRMLVPSFTARFEAYGRGGLTPLDIIALDGQKLRVMNLSMRLNAAENQWWMNIEGEWITTQSSDQAAELNNNPSTIKVGG